MGVGEEGQAMTKEVVRVDATGTEIRYRVEGCACGSGYWLVPMGKGRALHFTGAPPP